MKDRLSTRNILRRKNIQLESYNCVLFQDQVEEIAHHPITHSFTKNYWNLAHINSDDEITFPKAIETIRAQSYPRFFMMVAILMTWAISNNIQRILESVKFSFKKEMKLLSSRAMAKYSVIFYLWIQNLL